MLADWQFLMHNFWAVMNGGATALWEDQSKASLALIMALTALDQEEPNMSRPAGCVHVFAWKTGDYVLRCRCRTWLPTLQAFVTFAECSFTDVRHTHTHTVMDRAVWQVKWLFTSNTRPLPVTFGSRQQAAVPWLWSNKTGQQLMHAFVHVFECVCVCVCVCVKIHKSSCCHCGRSQMALRWRGLQHFNWSGLKHDTGRHTARKRQREAKQGCHKNYQSHVFQTRDGIWQSAEGMSNCMFPPAFWALPLTVALKLSVLESKMTCRVSFDSLSVFLRLLFSWSHFSF